jgi:hypothetical protein
VELRRRYAPATWLIAGLAFALPLGCFTRVVRDTVQQTSTLTVTLRSEKRAGDPVDKGYEHPTQISAVRIAHILSRIDVRMNDGDDKDRRHAFDAQILFDVGDALAQALSKANSSQEVVVQAIRQSRRLGIFNEDHLTNFVAFVKDDRLNVKLGRIEWAVPKEGREERLPEPWLDKTDQKFRLLPSEAMTVVGAQQIAAAWRDPVFKSPTAVRITPTGKVVRRTILLEAPDEAMPHAADGEETEELPTRLAPATLRELADLEEKRQQGEVSEDEYREQRADILRKDPSAGK